MKPVNGTPMIELLLRRLEKSEELDEIVVATSVDVRNQPLVDHVIRLGFACEQGSETDVLDRFVQAARRHHADIVVRITGDCPLVDPELVDECIRQSRSNGVDYFSNTQPPTFPDGLDKIISPNVFEDIPRCACHDRFEERIIIRIRGEHEAPDLRHERPDLSADLYT
jgi:glutamate-1-semialdehyde 2,1-aminomutase